jgi:hypothetical protein
MQMLTGIERLGHQRHDIRLRYRLTVTNGKCNIFVRPAGKGLVNKHVPGYLSNRFQYPGIVDATVPQTVQ